VEDIAQVKGMNRDLAAKIRSHLDEMAALLDREESADTVETSDPTIEVAETIEASAPNLPDREAGQE